MFRWWLAGGGKVAGRWEISQGRDAMNEEGEGEGKVALLLVITSLTFFDKLG